MGKYMRKAKNRGKKGMKPLKSNVGVKTRAKRTTVKHTNQRAMANSQDLKQKEINVCYLELRSRRLKKTVEGIKRRCRSEMKAQEVEESNCSGNFDHVAQNFSPEKDECQRIGKSSTLARLTNEALPKAVSTMSLSKLSMDGAISRSSSFSALAQASLNACTNQGEASYRELETQDQQRNHFLDSEDFLVVHSRSTAMEVSLGENSRQVDQDYPSLRKRPRQKKESTAVCSLSYAGTHEKMTTQVSRPSGTDSDERTADERAAPISICKTLFGAPSGDELEEFFAHAEHQEQQLLTERYNFDFRNEVPLQGRYEWISLTHS
ncbi:hypothetical protein O6H91_11G077300 [Diphasiastrum complanatum]|uniref:Uncharacterized protein n=1 Tax=Diphasiastrum complanatum TaxID=34168 RepID=A0ACC2CAQ6_DIPCM|nr:hypothetical protein O6H91_11G077300 [Diphasiastrum complanatum]